MPPRPPLSNVKADYLDGLRTGDVRKSGLTVRNLLTDFDRAIRIVEYQADANRFKEFLAYNDQPEPPATALAMRIPKKQLVDLLNYFSENNCLLQTNCFGFTKPVKKAKVGEPVKPGGRLVLISRGSFWQSSPNLTDEDVYGNFFTVVTTQETEVPTHSYVNLAKRLKNSTAQRYIRNFLNIYPDLGVDNIHGYLFPIRAMLHLFDDPATFGPETYLRLSWGLVTYNVPSHKPGNFSLLIQADDPSQNGFVIEFRNTVIVPDDDGCPPRQPCNPPHPTTA